MKTIVAFDLDGTLAESKQPIDGEMSGLLKHLLDVATVAVMSGGDWPQFEKQLLPNLADGTRTDRLIAMPTSGTKMYRFGSEWDQIYADLFTDDERHRVIEALDAAVADAGLDGEPSWGERIEDRGSQITLSALGQQAPLDAKRAWDPDRAKRIRIKTMLDEALTGFAVGIGGSTSVDVTREGVDKGYGIERLAKETGTTVDRMIFVGDALYPGGNDAPVRRTGIVAIPVRDVDETKRIIEAITACLRP